MIRDLQPGQPRMNALGFFFAAPWDEMNMSQALPKGLYLPVIQIKF